MTKLRIPGFLSDSPRAAQQPKVRPLEALLRVPVDAIGFENRIRIANGGDPSIKSAQERRVHGRRTTAAERKRMHEMRDAGAEYKDIAEAVGFSTATVWRICNYCH